MAGIKHLDIYFTENKVHNHDSDHFHRLNANQKRLTIAIAITLLMTVVELVGGILSNSLALISDAAHMFTDTLALGLSIFALNLAKRPANESKTYGYLRTEILAALANGSILILVSAYIFYESYQRFSDPPEVTGSLMLIIAIIGFIANMVGIKILHSASQHNLNVRGAYLHMWGDTLSSIGVIVGGIIIITTQWYYADPIISLIIALLILKGAVHLVWESVNILLESTPSHLELMHVVDAIVQVEGVQSIHDTHLWTITSGVYALSSHVVIQDQMISQSAEILQMINVMLYDEFDIHHCTLQIECIDREGKVVCPVDMDQH